MLAARMLAAQTVTPPAAARVGLAAAAQTVTPLAVAPVLLVAAPLAVAPVLLVAAPLAVAPVLLVAAPPVTVAHQAARDRPRMTMTWLAQTAAVEALATRTAAITVALARMMMIRPVQAAASTAMLPVGWLALTQGARIAVHPMVAARWMGTAVTPVTGPPTTAAIHAAKPETGDQYPKTRLTAARAKTGPDRPARIAAGPGAAPACPSGPASPSRPARCNG